jgi:hypothetical protein
MVRKIRKTKGTKPPKRITDRKETDDAIRHGIVVCHMHGDTDGEIAKFYEKDRTTVLKTIDRAKRRAKRDRKPLQALSNV